MWYFAVKVGLPWVTVSRSEEGEGSMEVDLRYRVRAIREKTNDRDASLVGRNKKQGIHHIMEQGYRYLNTHHDTLNS